MKNPKLERLIEAYGLAMMRLDNFMNRYNSEMENVKLLRKFEHKSGTKKNYLNELDFLNDCITAWIFQVTNDQSISPVDRGNKIVQLLGIFSAICYAVQEARYIDWDVKADIKIQSTVTGDYEDDE